MAALSPRVRPRTRLEALVDTEKHPPRRKIETETPGSERLHWTSEVALVALAIFWAALPLSGLAWVLSGSYLSAMPCLGLAISSLVVSHRIEAE